MSNTNTHLIISITEDLFFGMKIRTVARNASIAFEWVSERQQAVEQFASLLDQYTDEAILILLDLSTHIEWRKLHEVSPNSNCLTWVAYAPHVEEEKLKEARELGLDQVMPRSKFSRTLEHIISDFN